MQCSNTYARFSNNPIYDVKVTTVFPSTDIRKSYLEEYYVEDSTPGTPNSGSTWAGADGYWTIADPIVVFSGGAWTQNQAARVQMLLTFQDGSTRNETIVGTSTPGSSPSCSVFDPTAFNINGSLDLSQAFVPAAAGSLGTTSSPYSTSTVSGVVYSSVTMYYVTPTMNYNYWFWAGSGQQTILGIRYYTEVVSGSTYTAYTVSFEKTIGALTTTGGSFTNTLQTVYSGSTFNTLAETVLRQQVVYNLEAGTGTSSSNPPAPDLTSGQVTTNMQTRVVNIAGQKDFYISQLNSDDVSLSAWATSTIYIPTGNATPILAANPAANVFTRHQQITYAIGTLPFAISTSDIAYASDLSTVYTSVTEGAFLTSLSNAPSSLISTGSEMTFNGAQSVGFLSPTPGPITGPPGAPGTVQAWIYINQMTDTAGIIHKGVNLDFSDECYSLQGWGSSGQFAIILDSASNPGNSYDLVASTIDLNVGAWYYLVATWDWSTKQICLYINGILNNSGTMSVTAAGVNTNNTNAVLIGSQLPSIYSSQYGYFGFDGKIVGANVSTSALTAAQVLANYNTYKGSTASW
jgi:Concanavalin A-like lectin/glucanases superfamily